MKRFDDTVTDYLREIADGNATIERLRAEIGEVFLGLIPPSRPLL